MFSGQQGPDQNGSPVCDGLRSLPGVDKPRACGGKYRSMSSIFSSRSLGEMRDVLVNQLQIFTSHLLLSPRSPHTTTRYGSPINTFTVRPGTRHPISYACSGAHRKATS